LVNTSDIHQVADQSLQNRPVFIQHLRAASGKLSALQQDETTQTLNFAWFPAEAYVDSGSRRRINGVGEPAPSGKEETTMELRMRLNVVAAIVSFAFLTAIVVGMF
jgi:acyl-CoA reductase-like NAD-dependent aldehyde dehydrogenase